MAVVSLCGIFFAYFGLMMERRGKLLAGNNGNSDIVGPWLDPYGIARDAADVPGKKTYYIVDGGKNAIVDVKRLGKWGQRYVAWRGKRQKQKTE